MKRIVLIPAIALGALFAKTADAQIGINVGFHLGGARIAAQVVSTAPGQYNGEDYYYLPDVGAYYDVNDQCYFYNDGYNWVSAASLPGYDNYDWRNFRRFEVRANRPYLRDEYYRGRYNGNIGSWGRNDNRVYADRNFRRDDNRVDDRRFDNREGWNRGQTERFNTPPAFEQHNNNGFDDRGGRARGQAERFNTPQEFQRFNNDRADRDGGQSQRFNAPRQPEQPQANGRGNFDRPSNDGRGMRGNGATEAPQQHMGQGGNNAPAQNAPEGRGQGGQRGNHAI